MQTEKVSMPTYPHQEIAFTLTGTTGNPFDYTQNDVQVAIRPPKGEESVFPAFYDGGNNWRVRYTPSVKGVHRVGQITRNKIPIKPLEMATSTFNVQGKAVSGFVRMAGGLQTGLVQDNNTVYYPLGMNLGWAKDTADILRYLDNYGTHGLNWSRIWMCHWDGKNLDWGQKQGDMSLEVAKKWDSILASAEKNGVYFQMVLQHHGPYASRTDSNWNENPWNLVNAKNGGFLAKPEDFFTNTKAIALTKLKYCYIIARYGYAPHILAWELFNEVEWVDAIAKTGVVAKWHADMAAFLREHDPYKHLITTSSSRNIPNLYNACDYEQPHTYPADGIAAVRLLHNELRPRPGFIGEIGPQGSLQSENGSFLQSVVWSSLMTPSIGAAQYWTWDVVDAKKLYPPLAAAAQFAKEVNFGAWTNANCSRLVVTTKESGEASSGPGKGWDTATQTAFTVTPEGEISGIEKMPSFLQGTAHREMFPRADFTVTMPSTGLFRVRISQSAKAGAHVKISVNGTVALEKDFVPASTDTRQDTWLEVPLSAGKQKIRLENTGSDWVVVSRIAFTPFGPTRAALCKAAANKNEAILYTYKVGAGKTTTSDTLTLPDLTPGRYKVTWWNVTQNQKLNTQLIAITGNTPATLIIPITEDAAAWIKRA
jgi:hypothetical protein